MFNFTNFETRRKKYRFKLEDIRRVAYEELERTRGHIKVKQLRGRGLTLHSMTERNIEIARLYFIQGQSATIIATKYNVTRQRVLQIVARYKKLLMRKSDRRKVRFPFLGWF